MTKMKMTIWARNLSSNFIHFVINPPSVLVQLHHKLYLENLADFFSIALDSTLLKSVDKCRHNTTNSAVSGICQHEEVKGDGSKAEGSQSHRVDRWHQINIDLVRIFISPECKLGSSPARNQVRRKYIIFLLRSCACWATK